MGMTTDEAITRLKQFSQIKSFTGYVSGAESPVSANDSFAAAFTPRGTMRPRLRSLENKRLAAAH